MSKAIAEIAIGAAIVALDIVAPEIGLPLTPWLTGALLGAGSSLVVGGIGTLLTKQQQGLSANVMNPIQPWNVVYGQAKIGGTVVYMEDTGADNRYLHIVYVLACHPCHSIDEVLFDSKRICLDSSGDSLSFDDSTSVIASQQTVSISSITRANNVVTVVMANAMPLPASTAAGPALQTGDTVQIQNVSADETLNGQYVIQMSNDTTFTYICGGNAVTTSGGEVRTTWPDYGDTVHAEFALGNQATNPFPGLQAGGDSGSQGLWTSEHALQGRTAIYLRLKYGGDTYQSGLPTISFLVSGKNNIYDPRTGSNVYTTNSALCIADYLCEPTWGYKCNYGTDVPLGPLISAANICDEGVTLAAGGTEARYTCNGSFQLNAKRGEILQNLLTSCGGRLTYSGGQFVVNPAAWTGATVQMGGATPTNASGSPIVSAALTVWASWVEGSTGYGSPHIDVVYGQLRMSSINQSPSYSGMNLTGISGTAAAFSFNIPTSNLFELTQTSVVASIQGTLDGDDAGPVSTLNIYDCYLFVTYQDGTSETIRPASTFESSGYGSGIFYSGVSGVVSDPQNAIDADSNPPTTYASIVRSHYYGLSSAGYLQCYNWPFPSSNSVTPTPITPLTYAAGPFQWKPKVAVRDLYNGVKATYVCPANNWQPSDMPPYAQDADHGYASDANLTADGGERRWLDLQFPFTLSTATAQRLAKIELLRRRQQGAGTFVFNLAMYQLTALDVVEFTLPPLNWTAKLLEVTAHRFTVNKQQNDKGSDAIVLGTELDLQETDPSVYTWSTSEELTAQGYQQPSLIGTQSISAPTTVTATNSTVAGSGITQGQVQVTWSAPTDGFVTNGGQTIVQYSLDDTNWIPLGTYDSSVTTAFVPNVAAGQEYWVRVAFVNVAGVQSGWTVYGPMTATGSSLNYYTTSWTSQTSVTVTHNLGTTNVLVQVRDASNVLVQPESIVITNSNVVTLTFGAAFSGSVLIFAL